MKSYLYNWYKNIYSGLQNIIQWTLLKMKFKKYYKLRTACIIVFHLNIDPMWPAKSFSYCYNMTNLMDCLQIVNQNKSFLF